MVHVDFNMVDMDGEESSEMEGGFNGHNEEDEFQNKEV